MNTFSIVPHHIREPSSYYTVPLVHTVISHDFKCTAFSLSPEESKEDVDSATQGQRGKLITPPSLQVR